jgi:hypothetical protein
MTSIPTTSQKTIEEMETWEIFQQVIPRGESDRVAEILRRRGVKCTGAQVRSWRNDPDVNEDSDADPHGRRNPLDEIIEVLNAVGARKPGGAATMAKKIEYEAARIEADNDREEMLKDREAIRKARELAKQFLETTEQFGDG